MRQYRRRERTFVTAVRLDLNTDGFTYLKWGGTQRCKRGDWLVNNQGDVYTIDAETFERTYQMVSPGLYEKVAPVWAEVAAEPGTISDQGRIHRVYRRRLSRVQCSRP